MRPSYFLTLTLATACFAQDASVGTPALGFAFDETSQAIRVIRGIPGAALVEDPLDAGFSIRSAAASPRRNFALVTGADSSVRLVRFQDGGAAAEPLQDAMPAADRIAFGPDGRSALLYHAGRLQSVSGLPDRPLVRDWDTPLLPETIAAMAISDDSRFVVVASGGDDSATVWLFTSDGGASRLPLPGSTTAVAFRRGRPDLLALAGSGDLYLIRDIGANSEYRSFAGAGAPDGTAVQFSPDGARGFTAAADGSLSVVDLESGDTQRLSCGCRAGSLEPLSLENIFRVTPAADLPVMLLDASKPEPRTWFVPNVRMRRQEGGAQ